MPKNNGGKQTSVSTEKQAMNSMKFEVAKELGVNLKEGFNGDLSAQETGRVGGNMVKKMIQLAKSNLK